MKTIYEVVRIKQVISYINGGDQSTFRSPNDGAKVAAMFIGDGERKVFFVMCLYTKNRVVAVHRCHVGALISSIVHPREVFKSAVLNNAASILVFHQHPSQDLTPSREDIMVRKGSLKQEGSSG